jgi:hypothetical protein
MKLLGKWLSEDEHQRWPSERSIGASEPLSLSLSLPLPPTAPPQEYEREVRGRIVLGDISNVIMSM